MKRTIYSIAMFAIAITMVGSSGIAYAQIMGTPEDDATMVIIVAALIGSFVAPIFHWAVAKTKEGENNPFDWKQYIVALIVVIPTTMGLIATQISVLNIEVTTLQAVIVLFITVFIEALGINMIKAGTAQRIKK